MALLDSGAASSFTGTEPAGSASPVITPEADDGEYWTVGAGTPQEKKFRNMDKAFAYAEVQRRAELERQKAEEAAANKQQQKRD